MSGHSWARLVALTLTVGAFVASAGAARPADPLFDVPRLEGIRIDGDPADWGDRGFRVECLTDDQGGRRSAASFDPRFRLGWNDEGLLLLVEVRDATAYETPSLDDIYMGDCVEIFVAEKASAPAECYQVLISPGRDPAQPKVRVKFFDRHHPANKHFAAQVERVVRPDGYVMEVLLPWKNLHPAPAAGEVMGLGLWVDEASALGNVSFAGWQPRVVPNVPGQAVHAVRLAQTASPPVEAFSRADYVYTRRVQITVAASAGQVGQPVEIREGGSVVARAQVEGVTGGAEAQVFVPAPTHRPYPTYQVFLGGKPSGELSLEETALARAFQGLQLTYRFHPAIFDGSTFPAGSFHQRAEADDLLGRYPVKTTFYDVNYKVVTKAEKPGRYGAVVEVTPEGEAPFLIFQTLFRVPNADTVKPEWTKEWLLAQGASLGFDPAVMKDEAGVIDEVFRYVPKAGAEDDWRLAALAAGLFEAKPMGKTAYCQDDVIAQDRQWWVGLKRKLYGAETKYPGPFVCPHPLAGPPAPVLHEGGAAEAGMKPEAAAKIDAVLQQWAADSNEPFAVCIARHGVIVLSKAYGLREKKAGVTCHLLGSYPNAPSVPPQEARPMSLTDRCWMASITKLMAGTAMMMAVDQGLVGLDDPVSKFLPTFHEAEVTKPVIIRYLYTHTSGLGEYWGWCDDKHDLEQILGRYYPYLPVANHFEYTGTGGTLGSKVLEMVTGEALPLFYKHHLLDPLGCKDTEVSGSEGDAWSTAPDLAKIGQMLLNKGAYGNLRFFSEKTYEKMLPVELSWVAKPDVDVRTWGIGVAEFGPDALGRKSFGHGAASDSFLRIDPEHDLVVVMARNAAGTNYKKYESQFIQAIVEGMATSAR